MGLDKPFDSLVEKLGAWLESLILMLPNLLLAVLVVLVAVFLARTARRVLSSIMNRVSPLRQVNELVSTVAYMIVFTAGVFIALGILELDKTVTSLLAGVGIVGLALGFAFQDIAANFISGVLLAVRRPFEEGQIISTGDFMGTVHRITLRNTEMQTFQGQIVFIPNKDVFQNPIVNYSRLGRRRIDLKVGVSYGDDLETVKKVATEAVEALDYLDRRQPVSLYFEEFGDSSINFSIRYWVSFKRQTDYLQAQSDGIIRIKQAFDREGITIPFPIRTLDFGIVGGQKLNEVLPPYLYERNGQEDES